MKIKSNLLCIAFMIAIIFLIRFVSFSFMTDGAVITELYTWGSKGITIFLICLYIIIYNFKISIPMLFLAIFGGELFLTTLIHYGNIQRVFLTLYPLIGTACLVELATRKYADLFIKSVAVTIYLLAFINFMDLLFNSNASIYSLYAINQCLLGGKNIIGMPLIIGLPFVNIYAKTFESIQRWIIEGSYIIIMSATVVLTMSGTSIIGVFSVLVLMNFNWIKQKILNINVQWIVLSYVIFWFAFVIMRVQNLFAFIIEDILQKDLTLTHRTDIWDIAIEKIGESFLMGHGLGDSTNFFSVSYILNGNLVSATWSAHNEFLQLLYESGLISLVLLLLFIFVSMSNERQKYACFSTFFSSVIAVLIMWLTEAPGIYGLFFILLFCYYSNRIDPFYSKYYLKEKADGKNY